MSNHIVDANKMVETPRTIHRCDHCGSNLMTLTGCPECGAPTCCQQCCRIDFLERELTAANAEIARLKAGGCARDQRTTQFCAEAAELAWKLEEAAELAWKLEEAVELAWKLEEANKRIAELEQWVRSLEDVETNNGERRRWLGYPICWLNPGQVVYVGKKQPEGLQ